MGWMLLSVYFSIHDFEPITGRAQPPPVHQTFETNALWFAPLCRGCTIIILLFLRHNHSNIDSDEVIYYVMAIL
jgi:hypothetical protein